PGSLGPYLGRLNDARRRHPALAELANVRFEAGGNDQILAWSKRSRDGSDVVLVVVNLDPFHNQEDTLGLDLEWLGLPTDTPYEAHDELTGQTFTWEGAAPYVRLTPEDPAHVLHLRALDVYRP